jgi:hypothetical protein
MKRILCIAALLVTAVGLVFWLAHRNNATKDFAPTPSTASEAPTTVVHEAAAGTNMAGIPPLTTRKGMSDSERLQLLEKNGEVFKDADIHEYQLAQRTSWWGKPLDPTTFWKGRVVWLDADARNAANRRGRGFPPMPYKDPTLPSFRNDDGVDWSWSTPDGPNIHYGKSSEENAFWGVFRNSHPKPPEDLEGEQYGVAGNAIAERTRAEHTQAGPSTLETSSRRVDLYRDRALEAGYPEEALSPTALFWSYVLGQRREFQVLVQRGRSPESLLARRMFSGLPAKYLTEPLTEEQLKAANAWKVPYLQRLRREKTDESYINAYLQAWDLSASEVFGGTSGP